jgi:hypothetical protein
MLLPIIHNPFHNPHFFSFDFNWSWSCKAFAWVHGFIRKKVKFELGPYNPRVDTGHHGAELHLVVMVIVKSFKDREWSNPWECNLSLCAMGFELWGRTNKDCILSRNQWWYWFEAILANSGLACFGKL